MALAPIVVFCYNRVAHLEKVIESLLANEEAANSNLIIYSDGPKQEADKIAVAKIRAYLPHIRGFASLKIIEQPVNMGLAANIVMGVTAVVNQYGKIIVVEDDVILSPYFLSFMNDGLSRYENNKEVACICGYLYPVKKPVPAAFFIYGADCCVWATWKDQWEIYEPDGLKLWNKLQEKGANWRFDFEGSYPYTKMLADQIKGRNNSWAVRWYASAFVLDRLTLYPGKSLVEDKGWDDTGVHCEATDAFDVELHNEPISLDGIVVEHNQQAYQAFKDFFFTLHNWSRFKRFRKLFKLRLKYFLRLNKVPS
ncbi:glycosyltransferase [Pedobacter gandavensis]|uniref:glycosyltransferase n=1 Tax=Pedobacter gandavensis TaxID=2679963 RepID=UPI002931DF1A|nr:glycosyltransferase [Pedobacter gandavensis]